MSSWAAGEAVCPFYHYDDGQKTVICEGCVDGCVTRTLFDTGKLQRLHIRRYCCHDYKECPICIMLEKKYE